jgi:PPOX class probable F420-dependent enzyme
MRGDSYELDICLILLHFLTQRARRTRRLFFFFAFFVNLAVRYNREMNISPATLQRLQTEKNLWVTTVRPDGRPHLTPIWFAWFDEKVYICIPANSVKARNIKQNPRVAISLEDGTHPVICEGTARPIAKPGPDEVRTIYQQKYNWDYATDGDYGWLVEITPEKWLG